LIMSPSLGKGSFRPLTIVDGAGADGEDVAAAESTVHGGRDSRPRVRWLCQQRAPGVRTASRMLCFVLGAGILLYALKTEHGVPSFFRLKSSQRPVDAAYPARPPPLPALPPTLSLPAFADPSAPRIAAPYGVHDAVESTPFEKLDECIRLMQSTPDACQEGVDGMHRAFVTSASSPSKHTLWFGPISTMPGEWISAWLPQQILDSLPTNPLAQAEGVLEFTADGVDETGVSLTFPPLHVHHIHVVRGTLFAAGSQQHYMETHGDYRRTERGYTTATPAGFCRVRGAEPLNVFAQFVDSRPSSSVAPSPLRFWLRVRFVLAPTPCTPIGKLLIWYPYTAACERDMLARYPVSPSPTLMWWTVTMASGGRIVPPAWLHSHRARLTGVLLLRGEQHPDSFGLGIANCTRAPTMLQAGVKTMQQAAPRWCEDVSALRAALMARAADELICHDNASTPMFFSERDGAQSYYYDRQGELLCAPHHFAAGERATVFAFTDAVWDAHMTQFPMHTILFMHLLPPEPFAPIRRDAFERVTTVSPLSYGVWDLSAGTSELRPALPFPEMA